MSSWKVISKIATAFGVISVIFAAIAGLVNYQINTYLYSRLVPTEFIQISALNAMLPFLLAAVLSFAAAALISGYTRNRAQQAETPTEPEPQTA